jgi:hypothetical protein
MSCLLSISILCHVSELAKCHGTFTTNLFHMFTTDLISQYVYDLPTTHSMLNGLPRVGMFRWYVMLSHYETEVHNSRRRYAVFTYGKVQLPLSLIRHDVRKAAPRLLSSLLDSHPLSVPRPHGTSRTEPHGRYGTFADQKIHMDEHLKTRTVRHNVLLCFLSQAARFIKRNAFFLTGLFVVSFFVTHPAYARIWWWPHVGT